MTVQTTTALRHRPLWRIAQEIRADRGYTRAVANYAEECLQCLDELSSVDETYCDESAEHIVRLTIHRLAHWRGATARRVKAELRGIVGL